MELHELNLTATNLSDKIPDWMDRNHIKFFLDYHRLSEGGAVFRFYNGAIICRNCRTTINTELCAVSVETINNGKEWLLTSKTTVCPNCGEIGSFS